MTARERASTARNDLLRYKDAYNEAQSIELLITHLQLKYAAPSAIRYSDMPSSHNVEHDMSDYMVRKEELTQMLIDKYAECMGIEIDILSRIDRMKEQKEKDVLRERYTNITPRGRLESWKDVAAAVNYNIRAVHKIHGRALQNYPLPEAEEEIGH